METIGADQGAGVPETTTSDSQMELVHGWDRTKMYMFIPYWV